MSKPPAVNPFTNEPTFSERVAAAREDTKRKFAEASARLEARAEAKRIEAERG